MPVIEEQAVTKRKRGMSGCAKVVLVFVALVLALFAFVGVTAWRVKSWLAALGEQQPASYAAIVLTPAEKQELKRMTEVVTAAAVAGEETVELSLTPAQFNRLLEQNVCEKPANKKESGAETATTKPVLETLRVSFFGPEAITLRGTFRDFPEPGRYLNWEVVGKFEFKNKRATWRLDRFRAGKGEPPWPLSMFIDMLRKEMTGLIKVSENGRNGSPDLRPDALRMLKRDGNRLVLVLETKAAQELCGLKTADEDTEKEGAAGEKRGSEKPVPTGKRPTDG